MLYDAKCACEGDTEGVMIGLLIFACITLKARESRIHTSCQNHLLDELRSTSKPTLDPCKMLL